MKKSKPRVYIGTSGWSYEHWKNNFYPADLKTDRWLNFFADSFVTVEINNTFYRMPSEAAVNNWYKQVPDDFIFSVKASRYISHVKRLNDCHDSLEYLYSKVRLLKEKAGPILVQLPPFFKANKERLMEFASCLDRKMQHVMEFRHESWFTEEIYEVLRENNIALCLTDLKGEQSPEVITADFTYLRLHGPKEEAYQGSYSDEQIKTLKNKIQRWGREVSVYCYFDNDEKGYAIQDAKRLLNALEN